MAELDPISAKILTHEEYRDIVGLLDRAWKKRVKEQDLFSIIRNPMSVDMRVIYSVHNDPGQHKLNEIAVQGKCQFVADVDHFWVSEDYPQNYLSDVIEDPSWIDVAMMANEMIHTIQDYHHVFLEGICVDSVDSNGVQIVKFSMGS